MQFKRFISTADIKNTYQYLDSQKKYEVIRTIVYFAVSISLYIAGYISTKSNMNLLTIVAVLGCLPASKSMVSMIMFLRQKSTGESIHQAVQEMDAKLDTIYDLVFTTEKATYQIAHGSYAGKCLVLYSEKEIDAQALETHVSEYLKRASISGVNVKVFMDFSKYMERLEQMEVFQKDQEKLAKEVIQLLKEITL